jgi:spermidine synthase
MGGTAATLAERRQAHLPLLLHPGPKRALFLGPGTGITLGAATHHPGLTIDGVELVPEVLEVMSDFEPENEGVRSRPGVRLHAADARRFVRTTTNRYDVIVADLFHPAQDGAGFLYTREHYEAVRRCLEPGGLFCQWLPLHQLDDAGVRSIVRAFLESFPRTHAFLLHFNVDIPALGLMGAAGTWHFSGDWLDRRLASQELQAALRGVGLEKPIQVLGCLAADPAGLGRYAQAGEISTDDYPAILFGAPRHTVRRDAQPHDVLLSFLAETRVDGRRFAAETLEGENGAFGGHLADFIAARELYLQGLVQEGAGQLAEAIERYLESTRRSVYFTASYARCVTIIQLLAATDRPRARELLQRLEDAQPAQPLTKTLRQLVN